MLTEKQAREIEQKIVSVRERSREDVRQILDEYVVDVPAILSKALVEGLERVEDQRRRWLGGAGA